MLNIVFRKYHKVGFRIKTINCGSEFEPIMDQVNNDLYVDMNYTTKGGQVPKAERVPA